MSQTEHKSLEELLRERASEFARGDRPAAIIDAHLEKMFQDVAKDLFGWGDFKKAITQAVELALPGNISEVIDLQRYNSLVINALRKSWESSGVAGNMVAAAEKALAEILSNDAIPKVVKLSKLLESFAEEHREEAANEGWESPKVIIESNDGNYRIYFDKTPENSSNARLISHRSRSQYELANHLAVSTNDYSQPQGKREMTSEAGNPIGRVYAAKIDGDVMGNKFGPWHGEYKRLVAALYYGAAQLEIDCDEHDIVYPGRD